MLLGLVLAGRGIDRHTLALSSTAIAMQAMNERNLMVTQMGRSAFGGAVETPGYRVIPLVAMIPLTGNEQPRRRWAHLLSRRWVRWALVLVVFGASAQVTRPALYL